MRFIPIDAEMPRLDRIAVASCGRQLLLPYLYREGRGGPTLLFVHGLGGAKENFSAAFQHPALGACRLIAFDQPGTGLARFDPEAGLDVSGLSDITQAVAEHLIPEPYFLVGASMGGLITLLQLRRYGIGRIRGLVNLEGNLLPEDCMFSRRVVGHPVHPFEPTFVQMMEELRASRHAGDRIVAHNMALNVDVRAYHTFAFQTVSESDSGQLIEQFLHLPIPRLFLYGEVNRTLSYLPRLRASAVQVREISGSAHFFFYDNPEETFRAIGDFVARANPATVPQVHRS